MDWYVTPSVIPFAVTTVVVLAVAVSALREVDSWRDDWLLQWFIVLSLSAGGWAASYALQLASSTVEMKLVWLTVEYLFSPLVPIAWLLVALSYAGFDEQLSTRRIALLFVLPAVSFVLVVTNTGHGLMWTVDGLVELGSVTVLERSFGPWFYVLLVYGYLLITAGAVVYLRYLVSAADVFRLQTLALVGAMVVPLVANLAFVLGGGAAGAIEFTSAGFAVAAGFLFVAIQRYRLFDLVPIGRTLALANVSDALFILDDRLRVVDTNHAADQLVSAFQYGTPVDEVLSPLAVLVDEEDDRHGEFSRSIDGEYRVFEARAEPIGAVSPGWTVLVRDVTERHHREQALERSNDHLEAFASIVSHDLRNPLAVATGNLDLLRDGDRDALDRIDTALGRMDDIISDVLLMARSGGAVTDPHPVDIAAVACQAWDSVNTGDCTLELAVDDTRVTGDGVRLLRLFENLFRNAIEHGEAVVVTVGTTDDGFFVADDGSGFPPGEGDRLFAPGVSGDGGTGLGLAIVDSIASAHGWTTTTGELPGGGARVEFDWS